MPLTNFLNNIKTVNVFLMLYIISLNVNKGNVMPRSGAQPGFC